MKNEEIRRITYGSLSGIASVALFQLLTLLPLSNEQTVALYCFSAAIPFNVTNLILDFSPVERGLISDILAILGILFGIIGFIALLWSLSRGAAILFLVTTVGCVFLYIIEARV